MKYLLKDSLDFADRIEASSDSTAMPIENHLIILAFSCRKLKERVDKLEALCKRVGLDTENL